MKLKNRISIRLARSIGRSILKTDIHPIIYIILLLLSLIHTFLSFTPVEAKIYTVFKWFNIGLYIQPMILTSVLLFFNFLIAFAIVLQVIWGFKEEEVETTVIKHYIIKGSTTLGFALSYALTLPLIQSSVNLVSETQPISKIVGIINLIIFLFIVYPYTMFLLTDISPQNRKLFAYVDFPNCFTIYNIYRPIAAIIISTNNHQYVIIPTVMLFCTLILFIIKSPVITWKYNRFSKGFICCLLWLIICRFFKSDNLDVTTLVLLYLIGTPVFILCSYYMLKKRMIYILKNRKNTVLKLKTLYLILFNMESYDEEIDSFLMNHYRECPYEKCCCHKIISQVQNEKIAHENHEKAVNKVIKGTKRGSAKMKTRFSLRKALGFSSAKNAESSNQEKGNQAEEEEVRDQYNKLKSNENILWFQLLYEMQTEDFFIDKLKVLPIIQRDIEFKKAKQVVIDQAEVLHYHLEKQYQSLRNLWFFDDLSETNYVSLFSEVRFCIEEQKQQETIKLKSSQEGSNQYALNYFDLQTKLLFFRSLLLKAVTKCENFWKELYSKQPDQFKIVNSIREVYNSHKKILKEIKKYTIQNKGKNKSNNEYEQNWELKVKKIIQNVYTPFQFSMQLTEIDKENEDNLHLESEKEHKILEKNLIFYDSNAKTGMGVVNVQEGDYFGSISATNKEFWEILNCPRYEKVRINHFLVKEMHEYHNGVMINFLNQNKHFLNFHGGYACDGNKLLVRIEFSVELLPHVYDGLQAAVFLQVFDTPKGLFLTDQASNILSYNKKFQDQFLEMRSVQDFDEIISRQVIEKLEENKKHVINLDGEDYLIEFCHTIQTNEPESHKLYFCEITQVWDDIPTNIPIIEEEARESFYHKSTDDKNEKSLAFSAQKKSKEKEKSLENLLFNLKSENKNSKIFKWNVFITVCLAILFILAVLCASLSGMKVSSYLESKTMLTSMTELFQNIIEGPYLCRKINILLFNNQTQYVDSYNKSLSEIEQEISLYKDKLGLGLWADSTLQGIEITEYNDYIIDNTTFEMVLQKYLLSAYTTMMINLPQINYDYVRENVLFPYPLQWTNFFSIIVNTHYSILSDVEHKYKKYLTTKYNDKIKSFKESPVVIISIILIFFSVSMQTVTILLKIRIVNALWLSLKLLEKIGIVKVEERVESLKVYKENFLEDLLESKNKVIFENGQRTKVLTLMKENSGLVADDIPSNSMEIMETTSREFQQTNREKEVLAEHQKKINRLKIKEFGKSKILIKQFLGILPIILLSISLVIVQLQFDKMIWNLYSLKYLYNEKIESIEKIKAMTYEFGYENDYLKVQSWGITELILVRLEETYEVSRTIQAFQSMESPKLAKIYSELSSMNFCQVLTTIGANPCTEEEEITFLDKSWSECLIDYIETARYVHQQFSATKQSVQRIREYSNSEYHNKFLVFSIRLKETENYLLDVLDKEISSKIKIYEIVVIVISLLLMLYLISGKFNWASSSVEEMNSEINEIKTILQLISYKEINSNNAIKDELSRNMYFFEVLI